jgi:hypothetical protein
LQVEVTQQHRVDQGTARMRVSVSGAGAQIDAVRALALAQGQWRFGGAVHVEPAAFPMAAAVERHGRRHGARRELAGHVGGDVRLVRRIHESELAAVDPQLREL